MPNLSTLNKPYAYNRRNFCDKHVKVGALRLYDVFDFDYKDGELTVVKVGVKNPQEEVNESRVETITELLARMPGKNAMQKVGAAVSGGLITPTMNGTFTDLSKIEDSVVGAQEQVKKARALASALPKDLVNRDQDFKKMLSELDTEHILKYVTEHFKNVSEKLKEGDDK